MCFSVCWKDVGLNLIIAYPQRTSRFIIKVAKTTIEFNGTVSPVLEVIVLRDSRVLYLIIDSYVDR